MVKFYMPGMTESETAITYLSLKQRAQEIALQTTERRIYRVLYERNGKLFNMQIGSPDAVKGEMVMAIIEGYTVFIVFTLNRGIVKNAPYVVGKNEALYVEEFE
jgi:hypothetical protein